MMKIRIQSIFIVVLILGFCQYIYSQISHELVDITDIDSTIIIDLKYATKDNFLGEKLYSANICLLRKSVAYQLVRVQKYLRNRGLGLKVWDAYRPLSVQRKMWEKLPDPGFVADPRTGSNHNRGAAVDVTLVDLKGNELEMPTSFDDFSANARSDNAFVSEAAFSNRKILQEAMRKFGFSTINSEWWHFNSADRLKYSILDVPLEKFVNKKNEKNKKGNMSDAKSKTSFD